ncbi:MAG: M56 family metallopeptidase [Clostridia bacterium]|nr:M56 family metallopeptidase [Clostridia bacterium]
MSELFQTVLILSVFGFGITLLLLCLKPITAKKFPAKWQYYVWIAVLFFMIVPAYKWIPKAEVYKLPLIPQNQIIDQTILNESEEIPQRPQSTSSPVSQGERKPENEFLLKNWDFVAYLWLSGSCIYLMVVIGSYTVYLSKKRKKAVKLSEFTLLDTLKSKLGIRRKIDIRVSGDHDSPMLVGVFFPVIYLPSKEIPEENMRMVLLHELTHYKRKDLLIKWFSLFVNAVHWFNPLAYLLCKNVSEACEISCDMEVTKDMSDAEQKMYMKTILDLVE